MLELRKCAEVSTIHISHKDDEILTEFADLKAAAPISVAAYEYGYFMNLYDKEAFEGEVKDKLIAAGLSIPCVKLIGLAIDEGFNILNIDRDGPEYDEIEKFHW